MNGKRDKVILITGINGFLGSHLAKYLKNSFSVVGLTRKLETLSKVSTKDFKIYTSENHLIEIFEENKIYAVIHTATLYNRNNENTSEILKTNLILPIELYELAHSYGVKLFVNTDTFFNNPEYQCSYLQDYVVSKKLTLDWLKNISNKHKQCKLINMKLFHIYGEGDSESKFMTQIFYKVRNDKYIDLTPGDQVRDFIYINDVVNAYHKVLLKENVVEENFEEYEVGTGTGKSIKDLVLLMKKLSKNEELILNFGALEYRKNEIMFSEANNKELLKIGWKVNYKLEEGLKKAFFNY